MAALLAAGYRCGELRKEMETLDYLRFKGKDLADYFGTVGKLLSLLFTLGIYNTDYLEQWMMQMLDAIDNNYVSRGDYDRTIWIPTVVNVEGKEKKISATDFEITGEESGALFANGFTAAEAFLKTWNFQRWKTYYREKKQAAW